MVSLVVAAVFAVGCANGLGAAGAESVAQILAPPAPGVCGTELEPAVLGIAPPRLLADRGKDLAAFAAHVDGVLAAAPAGESIRVERPEVSPAAASAPGDDIGEVAGLSPCVTADWAWLSREAGRVRLVQPSAQVKALLAEGQSAIEEGRVPEARVAWSAAAQIEAAPAPVLAIAQSYLVEDRADEAIAAYTALIERLSDSPLVYAGLGDAFRQADRRGEAADAWARGIALWPTQGRLVRRAAADPFVEARPLVPPPARRLRDGRWILAAKRGDRSSELTAALVAEAEIYAGCKERMRRHPTVRAALAGGSSVGSETWLWSPAEESACTALWLRAYERNREQGRLEDPGLDDLLNVTRAGFLDARSMFDVGAIAHPLATAFLTPDEREQLFAFVAAHRVIRRRQGGWLF
jgi:tetratricopeptide (TPR) repeat protein